MSLVGGRNEVFAGSELETYLRNLQLIGWVPLYPWSVRSFSLMANGDTGKLVYADGLHPTTIDRPQRFGNRAYAVIDAGQSTLRLDAGPVTAGISTANQYWGPAAEYPAILGNNAAGIPHVFI